MAGRNPETTPQPLFPETSFQYNPLTHVRVLFVRFIQGLFRAAPVGSYRYSDDPELTEIYVADEGEIDAAVVERMPAVSLVRGPVQFFSLGIDDLEKYDFATGKKTKGILLPGTMTINVCAKVSLESEAVAFIIADHLWLLRDLMMQQGFFEIGRGIQIGSPSSAGSIIANDMGKEMYCTPVSVPYQFSRLSSFTPLGREIIKSIEQCLTVRPGAPVGSEGALKQSHELPYSFKLQFPPAFAPNALDVPNAGCSVQPHPLNPSQMVTVRKVRAGSSRSHLIHSRAAIPITPDCMEQSAVSAPAFKQKG